MAAGICINEVLTDDELRWVLSRLASDKERDVFGLVCKRWLHVQSTERKRLSARAGPHMLRCMARRFSCLLELDFSQSASRSFYPGVTDSDLAVIAEGFKCLNSLNLHNCKGITDTGLQSLGKGLPALQSLDVSNCRKVTDKGLSTIAEGCRDLRSLHLASCKSVSDRTLQALSKNCCNLEELGLQGCISITDSGLMDLVNGCRRLSSLDVNKCSNVSDIGVSSVAKACALSLKTLKLMDCYKVGDESILSLASLCKNLATLVISGCQDISDESIRLVAIACEGSLKNLSVDRCSNVSDSLLSSILIECKMLETLDISCCEEVTDGGFQPPGNGDFELGLKVLNLSNCPKITVSGIDILLKRCSSLEYLDVRFLPHVTPASCSEAGLQFPKCCKVNFAESLNVWDLLNCDR